MTAHAGVRQRTRVLRTLTAIAAVSTISVVAAACAPSAPIDDAQMDLAPDAEVPADLVEVAADVAEVSDMSEPVPAALDRAQEVTAQEVPDAESVMLPIAPAPLAMRSPVSPAGFVHPGVVIGGDQLAAMRDEVARGAEPQSSALSRLQTSGSSSSADERGQRFRYSSLSYRPAPVRVVRAASAGNTAWFNTRPQFGYDNVGEVVHLDDARAAYAHALAWAATGDVAHADKAIEIMNAWSSTLTEIQFDQPRRPDNNWQVFNNGMLQAGWAGALNAKAAEIIRHTSDRWAPTDVTRYENMLSNVYLPLTISSWTGCANCLMTYIDATMAIGVFTNDRAAFDTAVEQWRRLVPTTLYLSSDGPVPPSPSKLFRTPQDVTSYWFRPSRFINGLHGETGRDLSHVMLGMGSTANAAETAWLQGTDLYGEQQQRLVAAYELHAGYVNDYLDEKARRGGAEPPSTWRPNNWVNPTFSIGGNAYESGWEVAYNHYRNQGITMANTQRVVTRLRPSGNAMQMAWETLTHAQP